MSNEFNQLLDLITTHPEDDLLGNSGPNTTLRGLPDGSYGHLPQKTTSSSPAEAMKPSDKLSQNQQRVEEDNPLDQNLQQKFNNPQFEYDRYFLKWLRSVKSSLVISSYKTNRVFMIGVVCHPQTGEDVISIWMSQFGRPMGINVTEETLWIASSGNLWCNQNDGSFEGSDPNLGKFDANYVPRLAYFSNDIDAHDLCIDQNKKIYYCSALFSCVCMPSETNSFKVFWRPPFITKTSPEDRCHLNGICVRDGEPRYVTMTSSSNVKGGWRDHRVGQGLVYDIKTNQVVCDGLTMPHSPRWEFGRLWVLESGTGYLGYVNLEKKKFVKKVFIPGYLRGLTFIKRRYAVVGTSKDRYESVFQGLPLGERLKKEKIESRCGFFVIDLKKNFDIIHSMTFMSPIDELYDVCSIPNISRPKMTPIGDESNLRNYNIDYNGFSQQEEV